MLGPTGLKKRVEKRAGSSLGTVLLIYVFTQLGFVATTRKFGGGGGKQPHGQHFTLTFIKLPYNHPG